MVHIKSASLASVLVGAAALGATSVAALPAGQAPTPAMLEVDAQVLKLPNSLPSAQRAFSADKLQGKRMWKGKLGRRGPWRQEDSHVHAPTQEIKENLINVDLGAGPHGHHGKLIDIQSLEARRHHDDKVVIVEENHHRHGDVHVHEHAHKRHSQDHGRVDYYDGDYYEDGYQRGHRDGHEHGHYHGHSHVHSHGHGDDYYLGKRRHEDVVVVDAGHRHHGHDDVVVVDDGKRHHRHGDVVVVDGDRYHGDRVNVHEHNHVHIKNAAEGEEAEPVELMEKRSWRDDNYYGADGHRGHRGHGSAHHGHSYYGADRHSGHRGDLYGSDHVHEHSHAHYHGKRRHEDVTVIEAGRHRHSDTTIVKTGRHGRHGDTTIVEGGRHRGDVTVVNKRGHGSETTVSDDGEGGDVTIGESPKHEPTVKVEKRHSSRIIVVGDRHPWRESDAYYSSYHRHAYGRPMYFGRGNGYNRVRVVDGPLIGGINLGVSRGRYYGKRTHSDDRHDRDRHCRHGECEYDVTVINKDRHGHHGHGKHGDGDDVTIVNNFKRDGIEMGGAPGYIDVTSPVFNSTTAQRIASLVLSTTNGTEPSSTFVLNASNNIRTQVYLVPVPNAAAANATAASSGPNDGSIKVNLKLPIFVAQDAKVQPYCATFDPAPSAPAPLSVTKCLEGEGSDPHASQQFLYDPATGVIHPDWQPSPKAKEILESVTDDIEDEKMTPASVDETDDSAVTSASSIERRAAPSAAAASNSPPALNTTGPKTSTDSTTLNSNASNVTLIFTPATPALTTSQAVMTDDDPVDGSMSADDFSGDSEAPSEVNASQMDVRDWPYEEAMYSQSYEDEAPLSAARGGRQPAYPEEDNERGYEGYPRYEGYPEDYEVEEPRPRYSYTAPYDWRFTKSSDSTFAANPEATFA